MDERVIQFRVGVMVFATLIITAILVVMFGELPSIIHGTYTIHVKFPSAPGVTEDTPVRKSGILIGRVTKVEFADDDTAVLVTAEIQGRRHLYENEDCIVKTALLGDASLQFVRSTDPKRPRAELADGAHIDGKIAGDPVDVIADLQGSLSEAIDSIAVTSRDVDEVVRSVQDLLEANDEEITQAVGQANETLQSIQLMADSANELLGDPQVREQFRQVMADMPETIRYTRDLMRDMRDAAPLLKETLQDVHDVTAPLAEQSEFLAKRITRSADNLDRVMLELATFSQDLNKRDGTLGQLIHNPELYQNISRASANIEQLTQQLKPIVRDARIFSDKIARHPGILVRDAIRPGPGTKGPMMPTVSSQWPTYPPPQQQPY